MSSKIYTSVLAAFLLFSTSSVFAEVETTSSLRGVVNVAGAVVSRRGAVVGQHRGGRRQIRGRGRGGEWLVAGFEPRRGWST